MLGPGRNVPPDPVLITRILVNDAIPPIAQTAHTEPIMDATIDRPDFAAAYTR